MDFRKEIYRTGDAKLDKAIFWILSKSKKETYADGTIMYFFRGRLPGRMVDLFWNAKDEGTIKFTDREIFAHSVDL